MILEATLSKKRRRTRDYPCQVILDTLKFFYILVCVIVKGRIAVVKSTAY